jgi:hypothetical protein
MPHAVIFRHEAGGRKTCIKPLIGPASNLLSMLAQGGVICWKLLHLMASSVTTIISVHITYVRDGVKPVLSDSDQCGVWGSGGYGSDGISGGRDASQCRTLTRETVPRLSANNFFTY